MRAMAALLVAAALGCVPSRPEPPPVAPPAVAPPAAEALASPAAADDAGAPPQAPALALGAPPRAAAIVAALRAHCAAALPGVWAALGLPPLGSGLEEYDQHEIAARIAEDRPVDAESYRWCVSAADGSALRPPEPLLLVGVDLSLGRDALYQVLVFREGAGGSVLAGHAVERSFEYGAPRLGLMRIGGELWVVLGTMYHPGSDPLREEDHWFHLDGRGGEMPLSLSYPTRAVSTTTGPGLVEQSEARVARTRVEGEVPVVELHASHAYIDVTRSGGEPAGGLVLLKQEGRRTLRWNRAERRFDPDAARSTLDERALWLRQSPRDAIAADGAALARVLGAGTPAQKAGVRRLADACAADVDCARLPELARLRPPR